MLRSLETIAGFLKLVELCKGLEVVPLPRFLGRGVWGPINPVANG
jgi:hypothetical protein